jgi:hypothetical protein
VPPILSVSFDLLNGRPQLSGNGHLVVCIGFTADGGVVVCDPWVLPKKGEKVRTFVSRRNLLKAWARSRQTVYLIYPEGHPSPPGW